MAFEFAIQTMFELGSLYVAFFSFISSPLITVLRSFVLIHCLSFTDTYECFMS